MEEIVQESIAGCYIFWAGNAEATADFLNHLSLRQHTPPVPHDLQLPSLSFWARLQIVAISYEAFASLTLSPLRN